MPRLSRIVAVDYPRHITQRYVRSMAIFHSDADRNQYLNFISRRILVMKQIAINRTIPFFIHITI